jgi:hypothetical protein
MTRGYTPIAIFVSCIRPTLEQHVTFFNQKKVGSGNKFEAGFHNLFLQCLASLTERERGLSTEIFPKELKKRVPHYVYLM